MNQIINFFLSWLNNMSQRFWDYSVGMFLQVSLLIIVLLIIDFIVRRRVRAIFRYCIWMLVFVKLVLPPTLCSPTGIGYWFSDFRFSIFNWPSTITNREFSDEPATEPVTHQVSGPRNAIPPTRPSHSLAESPTLATTAVSTLPSITWQAILFILWLVGVSVFSVLLIQRMFFVRRLISQSSPAENCLCEVMKQCRQQLSVRRNIELRLTNNTSSPAVCGLFRPTILIPTALAEKLSPDRIKAVLIHELAHIKRGDLWINVAQTILQVIYFYNPFVWLANAMVRRIREQAVDEMVLVALGAEAKSYSNTLIDIAELAFWRANFSLRLISVAESKKSLERRIKHMLTRPIPKSAKIGFFGLLAVMVMAAILLPMAAATNKEEKESEPKFIATLPNGVTVELVGVCEHPSEGKQWWRPDGEPLEKAPYASRKGGAISSKDEELNRLIEFAVRVSGANLKDIGLRYKVPGATRTSTNGGIEKDVSEVLESVACEISKLIGRGQVDIGVAAGSWQTIATQKSDLDKLVEDKVKGGFVTWDVPSEEKGNAVIKVAHSFSECDFRIVAEDKNGNILKACESSGGGADALQTIKYTFAVNLSGINKFLFRTRTYQWVTFNNVALQPGVKTDVQVEVGLSAASGLPAAMVGTWFFDNPHGDEEQMAIFPDGRVVVLYSDGHKDETHYDNGFIELAEYDHAKCRMSLQEDGTLVQYFNYSERSGKLWKRIDTQPRTNLLRPLTGPDVQVEVEKAAPAVKSAYSAGPQWVASDWPGGPKENNYALQFDGIDDYVKIPSSPSLDIRGSLTLSASVKNNGDNDGQIIWRGDNQVGRDPYELHISSGKMEFRIDAGKGISYIATSKQMLDNNGHSWTGVYDKQTGKIHLYKDGVLQSSADIDKEFEYDTSSMWNMIGAVDFGNWQHFRGIIDEVRIWNIARTQEQIKQDMNRSISGNEANLVAYWKFDEGSGRILKDLTKNHNDGQLNNWKGSTGYIAPGVKPAVQVEGEGLADNSKVTEQVLQGSYEISGTVYEPVPHTWWDDFFTRLEAAESEDEFEQILMNVENLPEHPAAGVVVTLQGSSLTKETTTDAEGRFRFIYLPPGSYTLSYSYLSRSRTGQERATIDKRNVQFNRHGGAYLALRSDGITVRGRIIDAYGQPVAGAKVIGTKRIREIDGPLVCPVPSTAISRADGTYELQGIDPPKGLFFDVYAYLVGSAPTTDFLLDIDVEVDGSEKNNVLQVPLVTEELLYQGRRFLKVHSNFLQRNGLEGPKEKEQLPYPLPSSHNNTITGIDIVLEQTGTNVQVEVEPRISRLLAGLQNEKYVHIREPIIQMVQEIGDKEPILFLTQQLESENRRRRCDAALALELLGDRRGVPAIIKELNDTSYRPTTRIRSDGREDQEGQIRQDHYYAVLLLGILGDERAVPALIEATWDETIAYQAAISLGQIGDKRAIPALHHMVQKYAQKPFLRLWAGYSLGTLDTPEGVKIVVDTLNNRQQHWTIRRHAIEALSKLGDKGAVPHLIAALKDEHPDIRVSAARALGAIGDASALPALEGALKDNTETKVNAPTTVSKAAAEAIAQIKAGGRQKSAVQAEVEKH